ncbi:hypothetical protein PISL3812_09400 [Talaromyces islandicus]|uniref:Uncharacterized protein n=1 Tax=Talaromyces islandicus TaxID=28573 RepID=A0A0U1M9M8_TALIS|nr:hypothetical protein PISL3812_09400 [Talaromyces islandicus]
MLEAETEAGDYWKKSGDKALVHNVNSIIMMDTHWACLNDKIEIATNPNPGKRACPFVSPSLYQDWVPSHCRPLHIHAKSRGIQCRLKADI